MLILFVPPRKTPRRRIDASRDKAVDLQGKRLPYPLNGIVRAKGVKEADLSENAREIRILRTSGQDRRLRFDGFQECIELLRRIAFGIGQQRAVRISQIFYLCPFRRIADHGDHARLRLGVARGGGLVFDVTHAPVHRPAGILRVKGFECAQRARRVDHQPHLGILREQRHEFRGRVHRKA
jgi:hypothetical protein